jgi:hypothetical protein
MKHLILSFFMLTMFVALKAQAAETTTECPMMREATERNNPKANLSNSKSKTKNVRGSVTAQ